MTWSSKKKVQAWGIVEGRGIAAITAEKISDFINKPTHAFVVMSTNGQILWTPTPKQKISDFINKPNQNPKQKTLITIVDR